MHKDFNWQTIELLGYSHFAAKGYRVLTPLVDNAGYDFVAEKNGDFLRVNVKVAGLKDKRFADSWSISMASGCHKGWSKKVVVDIYLVWLPHQNRFIEVPGDFFSEGNSKSKRLPLGILHP